MNDVGTGIIFALVGAIIGFLGARLLLNIQRKNKLNELNAQVDLEVKEAKLTAKRIIDDAELKAEKLLDQSEVKNERIKQRKIQEILSHLLTEAYLVQRLRKTRCQLQQKNKMDLLTSNM